MFPLKNKKVLLKIGTKGPKFKTVVLLKISRKEHEKLTSYFKILQTNQKTPAENFHKEQKSPNGYFVLKTKKFY